MYFVLLARRWRTPAVQREASWFGTLQRCRSAAGGFISKMIELFWIDHLIAFGLVIFIILLLLLSNNMPSGLHQYVFFFFFIVTLHRWSATFASPASTCSPSPAVTGHFGAVGCCLWHCNRTTMAADVTSFFFLRHFQPSPQAPGMESWSCGGTARWRIDSACRTSREQSAQRCS